MTAASYGDAEVARVLTEAGAQLDLTASATAGGVPGGTALLHGMANVVDALVAAGTPIDAVDDAGDGKRYVSRGRTAEPTASTT